MIIFSALELLLVVIMVLFFAFQVALPLARGTKLFPMFSRRTKLNDELTLLREEEELIELEKRVEAKREEVDRVLALRRISAEREKGE